MRFSHFSLLALSGLSIASPIVSKRADAISLLEDLYATVQIYTGAINATLAPLSPDSDILAKTGATAQVGSQINLITAAITSTTNEIKSLPPADTPSSRPTDAEPVEKRQLGLTVGVLLSLIIVEIFATVTAAVAILGLGGLLVFLNPLTSALSLLIVTVQIVLDVVLLDVIALLNALLTGLALGVSGL
ncbi:hypothetical protein FB567DRAFT_593120 [Paraphoma chrysanthemicola]|uniref:Uncharacterized protein n=1 Tax=Paraphoma chrysanthemicola TaxID=798071 RepID=A0A8K0VX16_9PLEO|nr:hypothetical protein FB567DRAFT_593120 [Paraphoma chrysanthemicola]